MRIVKEEYESILAQRRIKSAMQKQPPPSGMTPLTRAKPVYVYRKRVGRWTGPHPVISSDWKMVLVDLQENTFPRNLNLRQFNCFHIPPIWKLIQSASTDRQSEQDWPETRLTHQMNQPSPTHPNHQNWMIEVISACDQRTAQLHETKILR